MDVLFEGADPNIYKETKEISDNLKEQFSKIDNDFCFLYVGHWLSGNLGEDRKDTGMMLKVFSETFKGKKKKDRKSTRLNSSHGYITYAGFCLKKKKKTIVSDCTKRN